MSPRLPSLRSSSDGSIVQRLQSSSVLPAIDCSALLLPD